MLKKDEWVRKVVGKLNDKKFAVGGVTSKE